jgi:cellulose synthase/poly-beta-1,6-N-acetylglucosamine synthase-like glycosyltransferase
MIVEIATWVLYVLTMLVVVAYLIAGVGALCRKKSAQAKIFPKVSVVIAAKDEGSVMEDTLKALRKSDYPNMEIIVVSSDSETAKIARKYARVLMDNESKGKPHALNIGVKKARGEVLYFIDADCIVRRSTIRKLVSALDERHSSVVGTTIPRDADTFVAKSAAAQAAWLWIANYGLSAMLGTVVVPGRNFAIYKKTLARIGYFKNVLTEDINISHRLYSRNQKVAFVPEAICSEDYPKKFSHYWKQQERWHAGFFAEQKNAARSMGFLRYFLIAAAAAALSQPHLVAILFLVLYGLTNSVLFLYAFIVPVAAMIITAANILKERSYYIPAVFILVAAISAALMMASAKKTICNERIAWYKTPR